MKQQYTISIFTENHIGLLHRITIIFTRRHINIESITASESEVKDVHRYTVVVFETQERVEKVVKQIEKQVEVIKAFYHPLNDIIYQEIALYKLPTKVVSAGIGLEEIIRDNHARILTVEEDYLVIEKTGHKEDTQKLLEVLHSYGVLEFVRSGRVAIMKPMNDFSKSLQEFEYLSGE